MAELNKKAPATMEELLVGSFAAADAVAKLLIERISSRHFPIVSA